LSPNAFIFILVISLPWRKTRGGFDGVKHQPKTISCEEYRSH
jgi:hypothetical protein